MNHKSCRIAVFVSGTGTNLLQLLKNEVSGILRGKISFVVASKLCKALEFANQYEIPSKIISKKNFTSDESFTHSLLECLAPFQVNLIVLAGYMEILPEGFFSQFQGEIINIHPSLLPSFSGKDAVKQALDYGVKVSGCTVHYVTPIVDEGPIILQRSVLVSQWDTVDSLTNKIHKEEFLALTEAINLIADDKLLLKDRRVFISS